MSNPFSADNPPPLPPKQTTSSRRHHQQTHKPSTRNDPSHVHHHSRSADPPRTRPNRSQTTGPPATTNAASRPQPAQPRRSHSSDSAPSDKAKPHRSKAKKGSIHADVIDRLDFTGVGPMFHHDGPFDACAPSRNRLRTQAPMYAWTSINAEDEEVAARYRDKEGALNPVSPSLSYNASYPEEARSPPATGNYSTYYAEAPKKKVDALAEAWGMHEPEPYEEFFAGGGDPEGANTSTRDTRSNGRRTRDDSTSRPRARIPPPQPIFVGDNNKPEPEAYSSPTSPMSAGANVSRNKSIMQRIRRMRDSPNVPVGFDEKSDSPIDSRFPRGRGDTSPADRPEPYVYVHARGSKELPPTPTTPANGDFDGPSSPGGGLGRRVSLMKRVGRVVRGGK
ncbi:hypothetical protein BC827DRAFT_1166373 [Russula dissimulans]|nr:hypothetical protein BC827DRAFT_1166373 [Russula dissimulans]